MSTGNALLKGFGIGVLVAAILQLFGRYLGFFLILVALASVYGCWEQGNAEDAVAIADENGIDVSWSHFSGIVYEYGWNDADDDRFVATIHNPSDLHILGFEFECNDGQFMVKSEQGVPANSTVTRSSAFFESNVYSPNDSRYSMNDETGPMNCYFTDLDFE